MYSPGYVGELVDAARARNGGDFDDAVHEVAERLETDVSKVWKDVGVYCVRWMGRDYQRQIRNQRFQHIGEDNGVQCSHGTHKCVDATPQDNGGQSASDTQSHPAPDYEPLTPELAREIDENGDQAACDTHEPPVATPQHTGDHASVDAQSHHVPGVPWMLRSKWCLDERVRFAPPSCTDERPLGKTSRPWWRAVEAYNEKVEAGVAARKAGAGKIANMYKDDSELFEEMVQRLEAENDVLALKQIRGFLKP